MLLTKDLGETCTDRDPAVLPSSRLACVPWRPPFASCTAPTASPSTHKQPPQPSVRPPTSRLARSALLLSTSCWCVRSRWPSPMTFSVFSSSSTALRAANSDTRSCGNMKGISGQLTRIAMPAAPCSQAILQPAKLLCPAPASPTHILTPAPAPPPLPLPPPRHLRQELAQVVKVDTQLPRQLLDTRLRHRPPVQPPRGVAAAATASSAARRAPRLLLPIQLLLLLGIIRLSKSPFRACARGACGFAGSALLLLLRRALPLLRPAAALPCLAALRCLCAAVHAYVGLAGTATERDLHLKGGAAAADELRSVLLAAQRL